jgi:uncharacterized repeat protein (TIGR01451 family)
VVSTASGRHVLIGLALATVMLAVAPAAAANHGAAQLVTAGPSGAVGDGLMAITADGEHAYFRTFVPVLPEDTDTNDDVYHRYNGVTELITTGPAYVATSASNVNPAMDGSRVFFDGYSTSGFRSVYSRFSNVTTLEAGGNYDENSRDGTRLFFESDAAYVPEDLGGLDLFQRSGYDTTMITPPGGDYAYADQGAGYLPDDGRVFFITSTALVPEDQDPHFSPREDVYERLPDGTVRLRSQDDAPGTPTDDVPRLYASSPDGTRVIFDTYERMTPDDLDSKRDVYENVSGTTRLLSTGPAGQGANVDSAFESASEDGSRVFFLTTEALTADDTDAAYDYYERGPDGTRLVSKADGGAGDSVGVEVFGRFGASASGARALFQTRGSLVPADTDTAVDVYERSNGHTTLVSRGAAGGNAEIDATLPSGLVVNDVSRDGKRVFFLTAEPLVSADTDSAVDVYEWYDGNVGVLSVGPTGGNGNFNVYLARASADGSRAFFGTDESLVAEDNNGASDVYVVKTLGEADLSITQSDSPDPVLEGDTVTYTVEVTNDRATPVAGVTLIDTLPAGVEFESATSPDGFCSRWTGTVGCTLYGLDGHETATVHITVRPKLAGRLTNKAVVRSFETDADYSDNVDLETAIASAREPRYPRPGSGTPLRAPLVVSYEQCTAPNTQHVAPLALEACDPPRQSSPVLTMSNTGNGVGLIKFRAKAGDPTTPEDESDILINGGFTRVRCIAPTTPGCPAQPDRDFTGFLLMRASLRLTTYDNGPSAVEPATVEDLVLPMKLLGYVGTSTTAKAIMPGIVREEKRNVISLVSLDVLDPGQNGTGFGADCPPTCGDGDESTFATAGVFLP